MIEWLFPHPSQQVNAIKGKHELSTDKQTSEKEKRKKKKEKSYDIKIDCKRFITVQTNKKSCKNRNKKLGIFSFTESDTRSDSTSDSYSTSSTLDSNDDKDDEHAHDKNVLKSKKRKRKSKHKKSSRKSGIAMESSGRKSTSIDSELARQMHQSGPQEPQSTTTHSLPMPPLSAPLTSPVTPNFNQPQSSNVDTSLLKGLFGSSPSLSISQVRNTNSSAFASTSGSIDTQSTDTQKDGFAAAREKKIDKLLHLLLEDNSDDSARETMRKKIQNLKRKADMLEDEQFAIDAIQKQLMMNMPGLSTGVSASNARTPTVDSGRVQNCFAQNIPIPYGGTE
ncbi:uncharacterized protein LOC128553227, partial [Mercenaria mercenaria]|uniref:uncharacterized protein LOC128553227 n=1 Tax=Mercenaria mercenaria TaxID=6596 RepID=UPI00234F84BE